MTTEQLIPVTPQPLTFEHPWPDRTSIYQWWEVNQWPEEFYPGETQAGDEVEVRKEGGVWYWVVTPAEAPEQVQ